MKSKHNHMSMGKRIAHIVSTVVSAAVSAVSKAGMVLLPAAKVIVTGIGLGVLIANPIGATILMVACMVGFAAAAAFVGYQTCRGIFHLRESWKYGSKTDQDRYQLGMAKGGTYQKTVSQQSKMLKDLFQPADKQTTTSTIKTNNLDQTALPLYNAAKARSEPNNTTTKYISAYKQAKAQRREAYFHQDIRNNPDKSSWLFRLKLFLFAKPVKTFTAEQTQADGRKFRRTS